MWTENYLTGKKGRVVSNGFLSRATLAAGLDKFIIAKSFTGAKWSPQYASPYLNPSPDSGPDAKILRSSKLLADVIESLIGLSYVIGGLPKAFTCIQTLLPLEPWTPLPEATTTLYDAAPADFTPTNIDTLEHLINYRFSKKALLLEALTHVSYQGPHATRSYERLEFLGDAVLDYIISRRLFTHTPELSHQQMHGIRTAMANAPFLAFRMFETTIAEQVTNKTTLEPETEDRALWQFLRCRYTSDIVGMREEALAQHLETRDRILASLQIEQRFPWHLFALNDAPKFLSDVVESVIGAVYVDSKGDVEACERAVERLGVMECLERILRDGVDCLHPKERLGHLAVEKRVLYVGLDGHGGAEGEEGGEGQGKRRKTHRCQVMVGEQKVGGPVEGPRRLNAETIAAWKAVRIIEGVDDVGMVDGNNEEEDDVWHDAEEGGVTLDSTY
jgi:dsRNA-specific ribonuclease